MMGIFPCYVVIKKSTRRKAPGKKDPTQATFGMPDKKFGPAEDEAETTRMPRKILKLSEESSLPAGADPRYTDFKETIVRMFDN